MKGIFITGTGTGVGKTYVTGRLLRALRAHGVDALSLKPVQTGCPPGTTAPDLAEHWRLADWTPEPALAARCAPFCFAAPLSPHLASTLEGHRLDTLEIKNNIQEQILTDHLLLVEGAGGVLVPLNDSDTMMDLMRALRLPVLVVAAASVGTINHSLLTLGALRDAGLDTLGVVLSVLESDDPQIAEDNARTIAHFSNITVYRTDKLQDLVNALINLGKTGEALPTEG